MILRCLVEGNSIRAIVRMTGAAKNTVTKLLVDVGMACATYQDKHMRNLPCVRLQCDEIWTFNYCKRKNIPPSKEFDTTVGDVWTWTAICADTKIVPGWWIGGRDAGRATQFMHDLASRLANRIQLTSDGHSDYLNAVDAAFGNNIDYAMLVKLYGPDGNPDKPELRYSPAKVNGTRRRKISGDPDSQHISTSYAERQNLTMRMSIRRFTRLTNAFSKKIENLGHAVALHFMHYNYCRKHQTIAQTPAQAAGIADHQWSIEEIVALLP